MIFMMLSTVTSADFAGKCPYTEADVNCSSESEFYIVCRAVKKVVVYLRRQGFTANRQLKITIVDKISTPHPSEVFGQFNAISNDIEVLSLSSCLEGNESKLVFGNKVNKELHMSFIIHEVAHAIANENFSETASSLVGHEYIAYTAQLATMPPELRQSIINSYDIGAFEDEHEINEIYLRLNPDQFAVKAYNHLMKPENGRQFYHKILSGKFRSSVDYY
jgi:hypothetical protein